MLRLLAACQSILFIWFGHTPMYTIPKAVRDLVKENHPENVIFPGYIKGDVIEGAYSGADLFSFLPMKKQKGSLC